MTPRAGIVVTGTEVLSGAIADRNGPWLSERLREHGVELAHVMVVADRAADLRAALEFLARERLELVITSGGLGPTADDLTAEVVGGFAGREMVLDEALEERILAILRRFRTRTQPTSSAGTGWLHYSEEAMRAGNRKQAIVPDGATILEPVGTAPGLIVPTPGPLIVVLPGPPGELQPMWATAVATEPLRSLLGRAGALEQRTLRLFGVPESEIALSLRAIEQDGVALDRLEITTCLRRGEIEIATVFAPDAAADYEAFAAGIRARHADTLFSDDGATIDEHVARLLEDRRVAVAESCTGGLMAARLTDRAGSSAYVLGGVVVYSNAAKIGFADVP
jgi:nicotinamide-nucleotide amidase